MPYRWPKLLSLLIVPPLRRIGLVGAASLLVAFTGFLIYEWFSPTKVTCGCFGGIPEYLNLDFGIGRGLIRNVLLLFVAGCGLFHSRFTSLAKAPASAHRDRPPNGTTAVIILPDGSGSHPDATAGFTLVELLVVVGIIGLLLSILLPVLGRARRAAQAIACASHQRELASAALSAAADHKGFLQLDGDVWVPASTIGYGTLAPALNDSGRTRYVYWAERDHVNAVSPPPACEESPVPLLVSIYARLAEIDLADLGVTYTGVKPQDEVFDRSRIADLFDCPSTDRSSRWATLATVGLPSEITFVGNLGIWTPWWTRFDYATNAGLLGFHHDSRYADRRYAGRLSRVRESSSMLLMSDTTDGLIWQPTLDGTASRVTLADAGDPAEVENLHGYGGGVTPPPHDGRMNAAFVDGPRRGAGRHVRRLGEGVAVAGLSFTARSGTRPRRGGP